jgi:hypothetical protein
LRSGRGYNWPLDGLIWQETFAEIVALLDRTELLVAYLRCQGLGDDEIGSMFDCDPAEVAEAMVQARCRIGGQAPDLAWVLAGRQWHPPTTTTDPGCGGEMTIRRQTEVSYP